jgi:thioester reductase-like protein
VKIFITGATGFLGRYLVRELASEYSEVLLLSRRENFNEFLSLPNVKIIKGDITQSKMIDSQNDLEKLIEDVDIVLHAAALYNIEASYAESYMHNVFGTQNMLRLARKMKKLKAFYAISTIAIGDDSEYFLEEDKFPDRKKFNDHYSHTKYQAERIVRENSVYIPTRIIRPGIIIGDSRTGTMDKIDGPYYFMKAIQKHAMLLKTFPVLPLSFNPNARLPVIPVDHCAHFISLLLRREDFNPGLKTYHLVSNQVPTVREFLGDIFATLNIKSEFFPVFRNPVHNSLLKLLGIPKEMVPFMFSKLSYDKTRTLKELPELNESNYSAYKENIFLYFQK